MTRSFSSQDPVSWLKLMLCKNPPPIPEKPSAGPKKCFQQLHMSIGPTKTFEWKNSSQIWERRFWKPFSGWFWVKHVGWRFFAIFRQKRQKALVFRSVNRFLIQIFYWTGNTFVVYENIWFFVITLINTSHFSCHFLYFWGPENAENDEKEQ